MSAGARSCGWPAVISAAMAVTSWRQAISVCGDRLALPREARKSPNQAGSPGSGAAVAAWSFWHRS
jgi:hypothetical protein